ANQRGGIRALDEAHEAHPRIAQDGGEAKDFVRLPLLLVDELAPVELKLLARLGLIADDGATRGCRRWAQGAHEVFEDTDLPGVPERLQPRQHGLAVIQMIFLHPTPDLVVERIQLRGALRSGASHRCASRVATHRVACQAEFPGDRPYRLAL